MKIWLYNACFCPKSTQLPHHVSHQYNTILPGGGYCVQCCLYSNLCKTWRQYLNTNTNQYFLFCCAGMLSSYFHRKSKFCKTFFNFVLNDIDIEAAKTILIKIFNVPLQKSCQVRKRGWVTYVTYIQSQFRFI